jgi:hypothetical protein
MHRSRQCMASHIMAIGPKFKGLIWQCQEVPDQTQIDSNRSHVQRSIFLPLIIDRTVTYLNYILQASESANSNLLVLHVHKFV